MLGEGIVGIHPVVPVRRRRPPVETPPRSSVMVSCAGLALSWEMVAMKTPMTMINAPSVSSKGHSSSTTVPSAVAPTGSRRMTAPTMVAGT